MQELALEGVFRIAIVGAGGYGRVALDVLVAAGVEDYVIGFYDDAHAVLPESVRGFPVLGDIGMLKEHALGRVGVLYSRDHGQRGAVAGGELYKGVGRALCNGRTSDGIRFDGGYYRRRIGARGGRCRTPRRGARKPLPGRG